MGVPFTARQASALCPRGGVFARVIRGGPVKTGDVIEVHSGEVTTD